MKRGAAFKGDSRAQLNRKRPRGTLAAASLSTLLWCGCSLNPIGEDPGFDNDSQTTGGTPTITDPAQGNPIPAGTAPLPANTAGPSPTTLPTDSPTPSPGPADPSDDDDVIIDEPEPPVLEPEPESGPSEPGPIDANAGDGGYPFDGGAPTDAGGDLAPAR